mgnify:CR=1 FL=1
MPIYEYRCEACGQEFEKRVASASQGGDVSCPACGQPKATKKLSTFAAVTRGGRSSEAAPACPAGGCCSGGACGLN